MITVTNVNECPTAVATVYYLAPPPPEGHSDPRMTHFLGVCTERLPARIVYLSTSGVYGDCQGEWVDESRRAAPVTPRAKRRWDAERQLDAWSQRTRVPVVVLRVGGIYGPGRLPIERIARGVTVLCPDEAPYSNRIHADDLARVCIAAAERGRAGEVYNVADGHPTTMTDYFFQVADIAGLPRPACVGMNRAREELSPGMLSFVNESRRLQTAKLKRELRIELHYPSLKEGLQASYP